MSVLSRLFPSSFEQQLVRRLAAKPEAAVEIIVDGVRCWAISDQLMAGLMVTHGVRPTRVKV